MFNDEFRMILNHCIPALSDQTYAVWLFGLKTRQSSQDLFENKHQITLF